MTTESRAAGATGSDERLGRDVRLSDPQGCPTVPCAGAERHLAKAVLLGVPALPLEVTPRVIHRPGYGCERQIPLGQVNVAERRSWAHVFR
jgi:hypothetical protein